MSADKPLISIISVNYNQTEVTGAFLDSVEKLSYPNVEVILVDNGSKENPGDWITSRYPSVRFLRSADNLGFSGGNNLGIKAARGTYFFFVNNDTELSEDVLDLLLKTAVENPNAGIVCPLLQYYEAPRLIQFAGYTALHPITARNKTIGQFEEDRGQFQNLTSSAFAHGAAMFVPRKVVEKAGMMPEMFFLYYEELDWSSRIRKAGYDILVNPKARVLHKESVTVGKSSPLKTHYMNRNRVLYMRRHAELLPRISFILYFLIIVSPKNLLQFALKGQWDHFRAFVRALTWNLSHSAADKPGSLTLAPLKEMPQGFSGTVPLSRRESA